MLNSKKTPSMYSQFYKLYSDYIDFNYTSGRKLNREPINRIAIYV